jgi:hypothetical protein
MKDLPLTNTLVIGASHKLQRKGSVENTAPGNFFTNASFFYNLQMGLVS